MLSRRASVLALGVGAVAAAAIVLAAATRDAGPESPFREHTLLVRPDPQLLAAAGQAAADGDGHRHDVLARLSVVPTATWLTPELLPTPSAATTMVSGVLAEAGRDGELATFVVYGITNRDCAGGLSSGGLPADEYDAWTHAIADAVADGPAVVVLEPDALVSASECGIAEERMSQLKRALTSFADAGVTTYVDAGHPAWVPPEDAARLLNEVGVGTVRGFAVNVANYQPLVATTVWATRVSDLTGGAHFLIDTGRNGASAGTVDDWCNPDGQALGTEPGYVDDGTRLDALLWVKPPWESDGTCHGGPAAGQFWLDRAVELATTAGW